ncbi:hypothetical protein [Sanyastnella coralliicola]|uniref:hypothetical protein n=1 Tax=Sanyastnella coralliicola TaxID=3069118 RepID=UPI0027B94C5D|nr:hypothetical protein [Longitalea sp. SCSIO 12813]
MRHTIFYSWQSDLPNSSNRGFVKSCIEKSIRRFRESSKSEFPIELDHDTRGQLGSPEILNTILRKINSCKIFIADMSIINPHSSTRKTPNPNVLFETGYAVRALGWERVVCLFNSDFGDLNDLPFDIPQRRVIQYGLNGKSKSEEKERVSSIIASVIGEFRQSSEWHDPVNDYFKGKIDRVFLGYGEWLYRILRGVDVNGGPNSFSYLMDMEVREITECLKSCESLGFQLFRSQKEHVRGLIEAIDLMLSSGLFSREVISLILEFKTLVERSYSMLNINSRVKVFERSENRSELYRLARHDHFLNVKSYYEYRLYHLVRNDFENSSTVIVDRGEFSAQVKDDELTMIYTPVIEHLDRLISVYTQFQSVVNRWMEITDDVFILPFFVEEGDLIDTRPE